MLRKHQDEFLSIIERIKYGAGIRTIYVSVCPGGGKSILPIIAGKLIPAGFADKIMWIAPRLSLTDQAEREFINPFFRQMLAHNLKIRSSTNEINPCRGLDGFSTTYQAVGLDEDILQEEFSRFKYILICDEFHHIQEDSLWQKKIEPLFNMAAYRIMLSGTLERGDGTRIAFLPYKGNGSGMVPDLQESAHTAVVRYSRTDALREKAIIPLVFHLSDCMAEWEIGSERITVSSIDKMGVFDATKAIYTALHTEFADELLNAGLAHWLDHRQQNPRAKCLVITSNIEQARRHTKSLKDRGVRFRFDIATSSDSAQAMRAIKKMKQDKLDLLVTVAMAYEGLDIPAVSHLICLTRIRSTPWIEQMTARANRIDPNGGQYETQFGYVFAPADPLFKKIVSRIEAEQLPVLEYREQKKQEEKEQRRPGGESLGLFGPQTPGGITPLGSQMTGGRQITLNGDIGPEMTSSEMEDDLLDKIESHIRTYAYNNRINPKRINGDVFKQFNKPRREMSIGELRECLRHVQENYPLTFVRGTGRPRVSTKPQPINVVWK